MAKEVAITVRTGRLGAAKADILIIPLYAKHTIQDELPPAVAHALNAELKQLKFSGAWGAAELLIAPRSLKASFVAIVGLGNKDASPHRVAEGLRRGIGRVLQDARRHAVHTAALVLSDTDNAPVLAGAATEAAGLIHYHFTVYRKSLKQEQQKRSLRTLELLVGRTYLQAAKAAVTDAQQIVRGVTVARELVNQPASHASPAALVEAAREIEGKNKDISLTIFDRKQAEARGLHAFLAVARGSTQEPYFIHLVYRPEGAKRSLALVGKGVTFDSGGLSLKPAQSMVDMKIDMAGAATVLGVFSVLAKLKIPVEVHGIIAACENMPSGDAFRPGDVLDTLQGKTIEVKNTDAEGRVTLADALTYAANQRVEAIIDLATLTGASMVALGETHAGLWSNNSDVRQRLISAARRVGEGLVALPLPEEYRPFIQSSVADLSNSPSNHPFGGAITAALFLQEFVGKTPWAHLDVAGPVFYEKQILPYYTPGATGYGVRTLIEYLRAL